MADKFANEIKWITQS